MAERLSLHVPAEAKARLQAIAQEHGCIALSGSTQGQPSISELVARIASGELLVVARGYEIYSDATSPTS